MYQIFAASNLIQLSAAITQSNRTLYCIQYCNDWDIISSEVELTKDTSPRYGVFLVRIREKIDRVIAAPLGMFV